jgi:hypothetical protein
MITFRRMEDNIKMAPYKSAIFRLCLLKKDCIRWSSWFGKEGPQAKFSLNFLCNSYNMPFVVINMVMFPDLQHMQMNIPLSRMLPFVIRVRLSTLMFYVFFNSM